MPQETSIIGQTTVLVIKYVPKFSAFKILHYFMFLFSICVCCICKRFLLAWIEHSIFFVLICICSSDSLSGLQKGEIAFGRTKRDTYIMMWTLLDDYQYIVFPTKLPDGIPVWVKVRIWDNGKYDVCRQSSYKLNRLSDVEILIRI